ncbi:hypothetical protein CRUP_003455 [Coryphaenoides rupestris]|nr:hypothetical protein CRUP_003455 [Coryphaenoides rupestris]
MAVEVLWPLRAQKTACQASRLSGLSVRCGAISFGTSYWLPLYLGIRLTQPRLKGRLHPLPAYLELVLNWASPPDPGTPTQRGDFKCSGCAAEQTVTGTDRRGEDERKNMYAGGDNSQMNGDMPHDGGHGSGGHETGDELKKTGKFCGGLILDIKRKMPFFVSDFTDAFHIQALSAI